ncbi:MAG: hypothetical protein PUC12_06035 [Clostridiales bacterium]|nr:hypothetical protein [Clostridiales bacterium]
MKTSRRRSLNLVRKPIPILSEIEAEPKIELSRVDAVPARKEYIIHTQASVIINAI